MSWKYPTLIQFTATWTYREVNRWLDMHRAKPSLRITHKTTPKQRDQIVEILHELLESDNRKCELGIDATNLRSELRSGVDLLVEEAIDDKAYR